MTSKELEERIENLPWCDEYGVETAAVEQLIRDCIEAVTPGLSFGDDEFSNGYDSAVDIIEANTKELLG